jgi:hypothetical protein
MILTIKMIAIKGIRKIFKKKILNGISIYSSILFLRELSLNNTELFYRMLIKAMLYTHSQNVKEQLKNILIKKSLD